MTHPDPDDPAHPARPSVRPFLQFGLPLAGDYLPVHAEEVERADDRLTVLRPFVITEGRTSGDDPTIGMETQVTVNPAAVPAAYLSPEKRAIVSLCGVPHSVAEISALLHLHLGVTRILVGDLHASGQLDVHALDNDSPDPETIMRVIRGLRAIT